MNGETTRAESSAPAKQGLDWKEIGIAIIISTLIALLINFIFYQMSERRRTKDVEGINARLDELITHLKNGTLPASPTEESKA